MRKICSDNRDHLFGLKAEGIDALKGVSLLGIVFDTAFLANNLVLIAIIGSIFQMQMGLP